MNEDLDIVMEDRGLFSFLEPSSDTLERLHRGLEVTAERAKLIDVAFTTVDSPVGTLLLAATSGGLVRVAFEIEGFEQVIHTLSERISPRILRAPKRLDAVARELDEYFEGRRTSFDLKLDFLLSKGFRQNVQRFLPLISFGATMSYKEVAAIMGIPKAVRAVGTACATNPLPVVVPCHRVLRADGALGGYVGGLAAKQTLLDLEATIA